MEEIEKLKRRLERERAARKQAELIMEEKALELYEANSALKELNESLEKEVEIRSQKLRETETQYQTLVENANDIIYNADQFGNFLYVNKTGIEKFGYPLEELKGTHFIEFIPDEYKEELLQYYIEMREEGLENSYKEFPVIAVDGNPIWVGQNVNKVKDKDSFYYTAVARDISQRKATEKALQIAREAIAKSEIKYRSIIENMNLGLMEVDLDGNIVRMFDSFNKMLGYEHNELIGKSANQTITAAGYRDIIEKNNKDLANNTGAYEIKGLKKDGAEFWLLVSSAPYYDEKGEIKGSIRIHYDITERKNMESALKLAREEAVKAQQAEKQFLASMSHEIRTPLNAIIGMSHLLKDTKLNNLQDEYIEILSSSTSILKNLISDILDISKIDAGTLEVQSKKFDIHNLLESIIRTFSIKSLDKNVQFKAIIDPKIKELVKGDQQLLNQVLLNLVSNADKFTETGAIQISATVENENASHYKVKFEVADTGIGMDPKSLEIIFDQFKQANKEIRNEYGGTGLGLAISKKLIIMMGGEIQVHSVKGKGSKFHFSLTLEKAGARENDHSYRKEIDKVFYGKGQKVLVIEDNPMNQKYISTLLRKWNLSYDIANNGKEGVDLVEKNDYELIFMDLQMPVMDGFEATSHIRKMPSQKAKVPIIALTASTFLSKKQLALEGGMSDFVSKPFTPDQLSEAISKYLYSTDMPSIEKENKLQYTQGLDHAYLEEAYGTDKDYAQEMFGIFLDIFDKEYAILKESIQSGVSNEIKAQAHKLKPTFTMVGLGFISEKFQELEDAASENDKSSLEKHFETIDELIQNHIHLVKQEFENLSN